MNDEIRLYTDGACFPNPGQGGWAWTDLKGRENSGGLSNTTNQVMELTAVVDALKSWHSSNEKIIIITDSMYVIKGATEWSNTWQKNGWKNSKNQPVANMALWKELLKHINVNVSFQWVKGHSGNAGNEEADRLATVASGACLELIHYCSEFYNNDRHKRNRRC